MTIQQLAAHVRLKLTADYGPGEAKALTQIAMENLLQLNRVQLIVKGDNEVPDFILEKANRMVCRLLAGEPIQHITGKARFCGMELTVSPDVLIPRPETEQLVDMITDSYNTQRDLRVIDLGTGSGCIAIALARSLPFSNVTGIDVSPKALDVASQNAKQLKTPVDFREGSILELEKIGGEWDVIVSNPPYVLESEKAAIPANVLGHDPDLALFVADDTPLKFYTPTIRFAREHLAEAGTLYFEINPLCAHLYSGAKLVKDMYGRTRFAIYSHAHCQTTNP